MIRRSPLTFACTLAVLAIGPAAALGASPQITDPAGDALNANGRNVPAADVLSGTVSIDATSLLFTVHVGDAAGGPFSTATRVEAAASTRFGDGSVAPLNSVVDSSGTARLSLPVQGDNVGRPILNGVVTRDTINDTITAHYPLDAVNTELANQNVAPLAAGTILTDPFIGAASQGGLFGAKTATDASQAVNGQPAFVLGR